MTGSVYVTAAAVALAIPWLTGPVTPEARWWDLEHRTVALIAEDRLSPRARGAVRDILGGQRLADASVWADNIRQYRHDADPLHYVNIPLSAATYDSARDCPQGRCIIAAIAADRRLLADPATSPDQRAEALRFLIHFMGDLHQPLHVADNGDRGGNQRVVYLDGDSTSLHAVWDGKLLERGGLSDRAYKEQLQRQMRGLDLAALERGTVADWAMEGHRVAQRGYRLPADGRLDSAYVAMARGAIDHAIIAAGVRLAYLVNQSLANYRPTSSRSVLGVAVHTDREAAAHVGQSVTVVGTVASVFRSKGGNVYVNFGADYPRQTFTAVALAPVGRWADGLDTLPGKCVGVRGDIVSYRGRVEIVLQYPTQLVAPAGHARSACVAS